MLYRCCIDMGPWVGSVAALYSIQTLQPPSVHHSLTLTTVHRSIAHASHTSITQPHTRTRHTSSCIEHYMAVAGPGESFYEKLMPARGAAPVSGEGARRGTVRMRHGPSPSRAGGGRRVAKSGTRNLRPHGPRVERSAPPYMST